MAAGDLTCSTPVYADTEATIDAAVTALTLPLATDNIFVIPWKNGALIFTVARAAE